MKKHRGFLTAALLLVCAGMFAAGPSAKVKKELDSHAGRWVLVSDKDFDYVLFYSESKIEVNIIAYAKEFRDSGGKKVAKYKMETELIPLAEAVCTVIGKELRITGNLTVIRRGIDLRLTNSADSKDNIEHAGDGFRIGAFWSRYGSGYVVLVLQDGREINGKALPFQNLLFTSTGAGQGYYTASALGPFQYGTTIDLGAAQPIKLEPARDPDYFAAMEKPNPDSDFTYELDSTGKGVKLTGYKGTSDFVTIPTTIEGLPVTNNAVRFSAEQKRRIMGLKLPAIYPASTLVQQQWPNLRILIYGEGSLDLTASTLYGSTTVFYPLLKHIVMLDSVTQNGNFKGLPSLESVTFSNSMTTANGLADCPKLTKVTLPRNLQTIEESAFSNCVSLESIDLPDSITAIYARAFKGCTALKNVTLPANLETLGTRVIIAAHQEAKGDYWVSEQTFYHGEVFAGCSSLKTVVFNSKLTELIGDTFTLCTSLTSVTIPANIRSMPHSSTALIRGEPYSFAGCSSLTEIIFNGNLDSGDFTRLGTEAEYNTTAGRAGPITGYKFITKPITRLVIGKGVTKLNVSLVLPNMPLAEQAKLRALGIQSAHIGNMPYTIEYR